MRKNVTFVFLWAFLTIAILASCGGNDMLSKKTKTFLKLFEKVNLDDVKLTIYYINPNILTRAPLNIDTLINYSDVQTIIVDNNRLKENIDLIEWIKMNAFVPVKKKSYLDARLCYVFETDKDGIILTVAMGGRNNSVFINGFEMEDNEVFYNVIKPFLTENAANELKIYFNREKTTVY